MIAAGVFHEDEPIELIRGEILEMAAHGPKDRVVVSRLNRLLHGLLARVAHIWVRNPIDLPEQASSPEPDLLLLKWRDDYYAGKRPAPEDVVLVIEVADSSLLYDRKVKAVLYAAAGIGCGS
jgi:Uma2 family endonuclease